LENHYWIFSSNTSASTGTADLVVTGNLFDKKRVSFPIIAVRSKADMINPKAFSPLPENITAKFNNLVQSLIIKLHEEVNIYSELYQLIKNEREIIRKPSIEALSINNAKKEACFLKAQNCKGDKEKISKAIETILKPVFKGEMNVSLHLIFDYAESSLRQQLIHYHDSLSSLVNVVRKCNDRNKHLLKSSIYHTKSTLMFIHKSATVPIRYMSSGQLTVTIPNGKIFNRKG
jgi:flagellar biosynthesis/type III secretory pathway chaperone